MSATSVLYSATSAKQLQLNYEGGKCAYPWPACKLGLRNRVQDWGTVERVPPWLCKGLIRYRLYMAMDFQTPFGRTLLVANTRVPQITKCKKKALPNIKRYSWRGFAIYTRVTYEWCTARYAWIRSRLYIYQQAVFVWLPAFHMPAQVFPNPYYLQCLDSTSNATHSSSTL